MTLESLEQLQELLDRLCEGDQGAAEQVFLKYEPMLRMVVRRMLPARLRTRFDSADIVQSVWCDLVQGFREADWRFASAEHLKAFLIKTTRNRYLDRQRKHLRNVERESSLHSDAGAIPLESETPGPLEQARVNELAEKLLTLCAPAHREIVQLKCQGCTFPEIAARTGYHPSSVRRIFYDLILRINKEKLFSSDSFS